jgi:pimeloyl-ACP methyl ester carboxylesterase
MPYADSNGIQLYYEERGSGDPLILIMGITAPGEVWEDHASFWEQDFRCIQVDNRGVGRSDKPEGPYTMAGMADDYAGLMEALDIPGAAVVGVSMGSPIAQQLALRHPEKVSCIVQMCPWARCDRKAEAIFRHMVKAKAHLRPEDFQQFIQLLIFDKTSWDDEDAYQDMLDGQTEAAIDSRPQPLHGLEGQAEACITHNTLDELPNINHPCLVIGGEEDIFTPAWMAREVAGALPNSTLHLYPNSGHAFHWENIEDFNPRVRDWLKENG